MQCETTTPRGYFVQNTSVTTQATDYVHVITVLLIHLISHLNTYPF